MNPNNEAPNNVSGLAEGLNQNTEATTILASLNRLGDAVSILTAKVDELLSRNSRNPARSDFDGLSQDYLCPKCNSAMRLQSGPYGQFWSCTAYRETGCNGSRNLDGTAGRKGGRL